MRIAHISDFHFTHLTWNPFRLCSKRILGHLNWLANRKKHFFEEQLVDLPALLESLDVELILLGGDFSTTALEEEFAKARSWVEKFKAPWLAIPGNHDYYTKRSFREKRFYRYLANRENKGDHPLESFTLKEEGLEAHPIGAGWWVISLDTARATSLFSSKGLFSEILEKRLEELLQQIPRQDAVLLLNHYPFFQTEAPHRTLQRGEALKELLHRHPRIRLYLHGHTHRHIVADLQESNLPLVLDSGSCAQGRKGAWNLIDLNPTGCVVSTYRWDHRWKKIRTEEFSWTR